MIRSKIIARGKITATVFGPDGKVKRHKPTFIRRALGLPGKPMISVTHNIVTDQGDALFADQMSQTPARQKLDNTHGYIEVGTAYSATAAKTQYGCHAPSGSRKVMDATYPKQKGAWGAANDGVIQYQATFAVGDLSATINEAALMNASTSGDSLAYGHISPDAVVTSADSLQVLWEISCLGS